MANCKSVITLSDVKFESCGDLGVNMQELLTSEVSGFTTVKEFDMALCSELIDVKSRKVISAYPTLRALYERYRDGYQGLPNSSAYDYYKMNDFVKLVGDYWVDLIEQVIPSTTIWGSTYKYRNTIFDKDKFKYKKYTLQTCKKLSGIQYPSPTTGVNFGVEVAITDLSVPEYVGPECLTPTGGTEICQGVLIEQIDHGSEFIGYVTFLDAPVGNTGLDGHTGPLVECDLVIDGLRPTQIGEGLYQVSPIYGGGTGPYTYNWSITSTGYYSDWDIVSGTENEPVVQISGTPFNPNIQYDGDLCLSLAIIDANDCKYRLTRCLNKKNE